MKEKEMNRLLLGAMENVEKAGNLLFDRKASGKVKKKGRNDFVTATDQEVQEVLRTGLHRLNSEIQFMGEEQDNTGVDLSRPTWILDPVDGTNNLIRGFRHSAVSLALAEEKEILLGLVYNPYNGDFFTAIKGRGAFAKGKQIHVSSRQELSESICLIGTNPAYRRNTDQMFRRMRSIYDHCLDIRRMGAASLDLCYVACGRADCYVEEGLRTWDYAAGMLILEEAGGRITDLNGEPVKIDTEWGNVVATNGLLHEKLMALL